MTHDVEFNNLNQRFYLILQNITVNGIASARVKLYSTDRDGAKAWNELTAYYDQDGNKDIYGQTTLQDLMNLKLDYNTFGGMDKYVNDFETLLTKLAEAEQELDDRVKKTMFIPASKIATTLQLLICAMTYHRKRQS